MKIALEIIGKAAVGWLAGKGGRFALTDWQAGKAAKLSDAIQASAAAAAADATAVIMS